MNHTNEKERLDPFRRIVPIILWFILGLLTCLVAAKASILYPASALEKQIPIWPPSQPWVEYLQRTFIHPLFRWDALYHFLNITTVGYDPINGTSAFYPLFPLTAKLLTFIGLDPFISLLFVSYLASLGFILVFERLARFDLSMQQASWSVILLVLFPISMLLFIPYLDSSFLFFAALTLYFARQKRWWVAGLAGMMATFAKQPGIFLVIPLAVALWLDCPENRRWSWQALKNWISVGLIPLAMAIWTLYRILVIEKTIPDMSNLQKLILALLVSSNPGGMVGIRPFAWPWQVIIEAINAAIQNPGVRTHVLFNLGGYCAVVFLLILTWKHLRPSYRAYSLTLLVFTLLDFSFNICSHPVPSLFRHAYLAFPIFIPVPLLLEKKGAKMIYAAFSLVFFLILVFAYVLQSWII
jgi:hypothetical protein